MTDMSNSARKWDGETGFVNVVGPPAMVMAVQETLRGAGIDKDDIHSEEFYGY
jgi:ferredoxin-NADP reductase